MEKKKGGSFRVPEQIEEDKFSTSDDSASGLRQLTNIELIKRAEESAESLELEQAVSLYEEGLQRFPNDTVILDGYSELLIQLGEEEKAKKVTHLVSSRLAPREVNTAESFEGRPQIPKLRRDPVWERGCLDVSSRHRSDPDEGHSHLPGHRTEG